MFTLQLDNAQSINVAVVTGKKGQQYLGVIKAGDPDFVLGRFGVTVNDPTSITAKGLGKASNPPKRARLFEDGKLVGQVALVKGTTESGNVKVTSGDQGIAVTVDGTPQVLKVERISYPPSGTVNVLIRSARARETREKAAKTPTVVSI